MQRLSRIQTCVCILRLSPFRLRQAVEKRQAIRWHMGCDGAPQPCRREVKTVTNPQTPSPDEALARRAQDLEELRQAEHESAFSGDQREVSGELSAVDQHPADVADITYQRELQLTTQQLLERESAQVEAAQRAREKGTYGTCQACGRRIPAERLAARPEATLCVDCQRRQEGG